jgi:hypothetical protein
MNYMGFDITFRDELSIVKGPFISDVLSFKTLESAKKWITWNVVVQLRGRVRAHGNECACNDCVQSRKILEEHAESCQRYLDGLQ